MKRLKHFNISGEDYLFDGNSVSIIKGNKLPLKKIFSISNLIHKGRHI